MLRWDVERVEVVVLALDLRAGCDREAAPLEVGDDVVHRLPHRMQRAGARVDARKRHVDRGVQPLLERAALEFDALAFERGLETVRGVVDDLAGPRALRRRQRADRTAHGRDLAAATQETHPHVLEHRVTRHLGESGLEALADRLKLLAEWAGRRHR